MLHEDLANIEQLSKLPVRQVQGSKELLLVRVIAPFLTLELACHRFILGVFARETSCFSQKKPRTAGLKIAEGSK